jgi:hypothetical protein
MAHPLGAYYGTTYNQAIGPDSLGACSGGCGCKGCGGLGTVDTGKVALYFGGVALLGLLAVMLLPGKSERRRT